MYINNSNKINPWKSYLRIGDKVMVHAYKYNGWLYRTWEYPIVIDVSDDYVVLSLLKSRVLSSEENSVRCFSSWVCKDTFWYISSKDWFNFMVIVEEEGIRTYINISSPYIYEEGAIKYYDFDLDFKINSTGQWREVDIKEFLENSEKFNYSESLKNIILDVEKKIQEKINHSYFDQFNNKDNVERLIKKQTKLLKERRI